MDLLQYQLVVFVLLTDLHKTLDKFVKDADIHSLLQNIFVANYVHFKNCNSSRYFLLLLPQRPGVLVVTWVVSPGPITVTCHVPIMTSYNIINPPFFTLQLISANLQWQHGFYLKIWDHIVIIVH